jgi:hypothetical protein
VLDLNWVSKNFDEVVPRLAARGGALDLSRFKELKATERPDSSNHGITLVEL